MNCLSTNLIGRGNTGRSSRTSADRVCSINRILTRRSWLFCTVLKRQLNEARRQLLTRFWWHTLISARVRATLLETGAVGVVPASSITVGHVYCRTNAILQYWRKVSVLCCCNNLYSNECFLAYHCWHHVQQEHLLVVHFLVRTFQTRRHTHLLAVDSTSCHRNSPDSCHTCLPRNSLSLNNAPSLVDMERRRTISTFSVVDNIQLGVCTSVHQYDLLHKLHIHHTQLLHRDLWGEYDFETDNCVHVLLTCFSFYTFCTTTCICAAFLKERTVSIVTASFDGIVTIDNWTNTILCNWHH